MNRLVVAMASVGLLGVALAPAARADEWDKKTISHRKRTNSGSQQGPASRNICDEAVWTRPCDRHIVQIFNADETHLETTILAIPNYRLQPTGKTVFTFWETPPGQPKALRAWFYPGDNFGQEFAYPKSAATQIAAVSHQPVPTTEATKESEYKQAEVTTTPPPEQPQQEIAQNTPPPAPPKLLLPRGTRSGSARAAENRQPLSARWIGRPALLRSVRFSARLSAVVT